MTKGDLKKLLKGFRPEFGNGNHIRALNLMKKMREKEKLEEKKGDIDDDISVLETEIEVDVKLLEWLIAN